VLARLGCANVHVHEGDGTLGRPSEAPFDRIILAAGAPGIPLPLVSQLVEGGIVVAPVGDRISQTVLVGTVRDGALDIRRNIDCVFVPLLGEHGWRNT